MSSAPPSKASIGIKLISLFFLVIGLILLYMVMNSPELTVEYKNIGYLIGGSLSLVGFLGIIMRFEE
jgi:hypothetical protein